ncbi:MAG TPA: PAS domain-containing protein [Rhizomicrobium sp.]
MTTATAHPIEELGRKIPLDAIASPIVRQGYDYWRAKRGGRAFPARADIHPAEIKPLLPNVLLVHVLDGGRDYQFRIVGEASVRAHGFNPANWHVRELDSQVPGYGAMMTGLYDHIRKTGRPVAARGNLVHVDRGFQTYESIYVPLGPDDSTVDHLMAFAQYDEEVYTRPALI